MRLRKRNNLCKCGCGELCCLNYKQGHVSRVKPPGKALIGKKPWNAGIQLGNNEEHARIMKLKYSSGELVPWNKGIKTGKNETQSKAMKLKYSNGELTPWNKGLTKETDERVKKLSESTERRDRIGKTEKLQYANGRISHRLGKTKENDISTKIIAEKMKLKWKDEEYINKVHKSWTNKPNKLEVSFMAFLEETYPTNWRFVGDGSFWVTYNGKHHNPDFKYNGRKLLIELFGTYWHSQEEVTELEAHFNNKGFKCLIIWDYEFSDQDKCIIKINKFIEESNGKVE